jgi:RNA chaperone Hfq
METNLLDRMLNAYLTDRTPVILTLQNKIRVSGKIKAFDSYVIVMEGPKREILYRHAVSSLAPVVQEEQKRPAVQRRPAPAKAAVRPQNGAAYKRPVDRPAPALSASAQDPGGINNAMKEGLLKWMREQKAAK